MSVHQRLIYEPSSNHLRAFWLDTTDIPIIGKWHKKSLSQDCQERLIVCLLKLIRFLTKLQFEV